MLQYVKQIYTHYLLSNISNERRIASWPDQWEREVKLKWMVYMLCFLVDESWPFSRQMIKRACHVYLSFNHEGWFYYIYMYIYLYIAFWDSGGEFVFFSFSMCRVHASDHIKYCMFMLFLSNINSEVDFCFFLLNLIKTW